MLKNSNYILYFFKIPSVRPSIIHDIVFDFKNTLANGFFFKPRRFKFKRFLKSFISLARLFSKAKSVINTPYLGSKTALIRVKRRSFFRKNKKIIRKSKLYSNASREGLSFNKTNIRLRRFLRFNTSLPSRLLKGTNINSTSSLPLLNRESIKFILSRPKLHLNYINRPFGYKTLRLSLSSPSNTYNINSLNKKRFYTFTPFKPFLQKKNISVTDSRFTFNTKELSSSLDCKKQLISNHFLLRKPSKILKKKKKKRTFLKRKLKFFKFRYKKQVSRKIFFLKNKRIFLGQSTCSTIVSNSLFNKYNSRTYNWKFTV